MDVSGDQEGNGNSEGLGNSRKFAQTGKYPAFQDEASPFAEDAPLVAEMLSSDGMTRRPKDLKLKKREDLPEMDDENKMKILGELREFLRKEGRDVNKPLKSVIESLVQVAIAKYHLLPDEFIALVKHLDPEELFETNPESGLVAKKDDAWKFSGLAGPLLESFFMKIQQASGKREPTQNEKKEIQGGFTEFVADIGTKHEQRRIRDVIEELQMEYLELDIVRLLIEDTGIMDILVKKITEEMLYRAKQRFRDQYRQDQTVLDFLFARVLGTHGKDNEKIGTQEKPRRELIFYLESIGYRLEHLMTILARQPEFAKRKKIQRTRRQLRMSAQSAMNEPQFGIEDDSGSFHTWFFDHFATDIAKSRRKDHPGDIASLARVTFESMARVMEPDMKRGPIQRLTDEIDADMARFFKSLGLHKVPEAEILEILKKEIDLGCEVIEEIQRQALGLESKDKMDSVLIPLLAGQRDITKIFMAFNNPKGFLELHQDFDPQKIIEKYHLREYAKNEEHLKRLLLRVIRYEARLMLEFWWKARSMMYMPELQNLEEDHGLIERDFIERFILEAKAVRVRWINWEEAEHEPLEDEKVPHYGCKILQIQELEKMPEKKEKPLPFQKTECRDEDDPEKIQLRYPEEVFYGTRATLDCGGRPLTVIFYTPEGYTIDRKSMVSRIISKLRQEEKDPTDPYRTSMIVEGGVEELALARHFLFNILPGDVVKLEDAATGRIVRGEEKKRPSPASRLMASMREGTIAVRQVIRGEGGKIIFPTVEVQLFTLDKFCTYYLSSYTITSAAKYHATRAKQLYIEVIRPATVYPHELERNLELGR